MQARAEFWLSFVVTGGLGCGWFEENIEDPAEAIIRANLESYVEAGGLASSSEWPPPARTGEWFKGELHCHSTYSDGDSSVSSVIGTAEGYGLDFLAITDHNTSAHWSDPGFASTRLTLLYGVEWTSDNGHANIWSSAPFDWDGTMQPTVGDARLAIDTVHSLRSDERKIMFSINHPNIEQYGWLYDFNDSQGADGMEVWNAQYMFPNFSFIAFDVTYLAWLRQGARPAAVGGSDTHDHATDDVRIYYGDLGQPTTWVYAKSKSPADIIEGLEAGTTFIVSTADGPQIRLLAATGGATFMMGETIPASTTQQPVEFRTDVVNAKTFMGNAFPFSVAVVFKNGSPHRFTLTGRADYSFRFTERPSAGDFYYVKLYQFPQETSRWLLSQLLQVGWLKAVTSPLYNQ
jgi:hypothetical protein